MNKELGHSFNNVTIKNRKYPSPPCYIRTVLRGNLKMESHILHPISKTEFPKYPYIEGSWQ